MGSYTIDRVKQIWNTWDIRVLILTSLLIQAFLTFLAPHRKRCASSILGLVLWLLYLSATAVALYVISQICGSTGVSTEKEDLLALWAPFLLLHLGGPDSITALALEDNELWHRHALELTTQLAVTLYVFAYSVLGSKSQLWFPSVLMFIDGCIKYVERTQALYYASMDSFRDSLETEPEPGPNYARFMDEYDSATSAYIPTTIQGKNGPFDRNIELASTQLRLDSLLSIEQERNTDGSIDVGRSGKGSSNDSPSHDSPVYGHDIDRMVQDAYGFYMAFRGLLVDGFLSLKVRQESREIFLSKPGPEAFRMIQMELNFMYDVFYTKAFLLRTKQSLLRVISSLSVTVSLLLFSLLDKSDYHRVDVVITYVLLVGAIALDVSAAVMFVLSDWWIIINSWAWEGKLKKPFKLICFFLSKWSKRARRPQRDRWSQSISQYNLLIRCFKDPPSVFRYLVVKRISDYLIGWLYVNTEMVQEELILKFIVDELQIKAANIPDDLKSIKEVCSARGNLAFQDAYFLVSEYLNPWTMDIDYDESLLTWHLATDICYLTSISKLVQTKSEEKQCREISKKLSDYMTYLLVWQKKLVSPVVGMSHIRFKDTCAEARKFMMDETLDSWSVNIEAKAKQFMYKMTCRESVSNCEIPNEFLKKFCEKILNVKSDVQPIVAKGDKSKSVLFEACRLAKQLQMFGDKQWEITSKVWLELLCYAAIRCSPTAHLAQLSKGGELITIVWLLMAHLGLGERFLQNQGFGWTKLIIKK